VSFLLVDLKESCPELKVSPFSNGQEIIKLKITIFVVDLDTFIDYFTHFES